jgi:hypothetical protein
MEYEMERACGKFEGAEKYVQGIGMETGNKETIGRAYVFTGLQYWNGVSLETGTGIMWAR